MDGLQGSIKFHAGKVRNSVYENNKKLSENLFKKQRKDTYLLSHY